MSRPNPRLTRHSESATTSTSRECIRRSRSLGEIRAMGLADAAFNFFWMWRPVYGPQRKIQSRAPAPPPPQPALRCPFPEKIGPDWSKSARKSQCLIQKRKSRWIGLSLHFWPNRPNQHFNPALFNVTLSHPLAGLFSDLAESPERRASVAGKIAVPETLQYLLLLT